MVTYVVDVNQSTEYGDLANLQRVYGPPRYVLATSLLLQDERHGTLLLRGAR